jgi:hypothetical protein
MQKIPLMLAEAGMVLARELHRNDSKTGMPICGKQTVLTAALIARLDNLAIKTLYVEGHPVWAEGDRSLDDMLLDLDRRFEKVRHDPLTSKLYDIYVEFLKRSMGDAGGQKAE